MGDEQGEFREWGWGVLPGVRTAVFLNDGAIQEASDVHPMENDR